MGVLKSRVSSKNSPSSQFIGPVTISNSGHTFSLPAFIDSGAEASFMDLDLVKNSGIPVVKLSQPRTVHTLDGKVLAEITHSTVPVSLLFSGNYSEDIWFHIIPSPFGSCIVFCHTFRTN